MNGVLWHIQKLFLSPAPARNMRGCFFNIYSKNMVDVLRIKLRQLGGSPVTGAPWNFVSQACLLAASGVCQLQSRFLISALLGEFSVPEFCCNRLWLCLFACWSFWFKGQWVALWPHFLYWSKKSCWFSVCSAFYLFLEWMRNSKHAEWEPGSPMQSQQFFEGVFSQIFL